MNDLHALIVDDEPLAHQVILRYGEDIPWLKIAGQCYRATEAYAFLQTQQIDILFLDIQMPKLQGLDFLRTLSKRPQVIITSAFGEYALDGFSLQVCDYLLKPFRFDRFLQAVLKAQDQIKLEQGEGREMLRPKDEENETNSHIFLKVDKQMRRVDLADIDYLESYGNYVKVWTGETYHLTARTLSSFVAELPAHFAQVHKSYVINQHKLEMLRGNMIWLKAGQEIPVGKSYRQKVKRWYQS